VLRGCLGDRLAALVPLLYGGSINLDNAAEIVRIEEAAGLFVGRTAWTIEGFDRLISICLSESRRRERSAQQSKRVS
jgi:L-erythrulose 1-phosphate isomerase